MPIRDGPDFVVANTRINQHQSIFGFDDECVNTHNELAIWRGKMGYQPGHLQHSAGVSLRQNKFSTSSDLHFDHARDSDLTDLPALK